MYRVGDDVFDGVGTGGVGDDLTGGGAGGGNGFLIGVLPENFLLAGDLIGGGGDGAFLDDAPSGSLHLEHSRLAGKFLNPHLGQVCIIQPRYLK